MTRSITSDNSFNGQVEREETMTRRVRISRTVDRVVYRYIKRIRGRSFDNIAAASAKTEVSGGVCFVMTEIASGFSMTSRGSREYRASLGTPQREKTVPPDKKLRRRQMRRGRMRAPR